MSKILYEIKNLRFAYRLGSQTLDALAGITLDIPAAASVCFSGPSGSGKTTLLNILGLIEPVQQGTILFDKLDLRLLSEKRKNHLRRYHIGFIFQQFHLLPILTAEENVEYFLERQGWPAAERKEMAKEALEQVGLWAHRLKKPLEMSGGQRQRVAIARALAKRPQVIIADEPTASLDQKTGKEIMEVLWRLARERDVSILVASHDPMVQAFSEYHYQIRDGLLITANESGDSPC